MELFYHPNPESGIFSPEESKHIAKVLRYENGDNLFITNGKGTRITAKITDNNYNGLKFVSIDNQTITSNKLSLNLIVAPIKSTDRTDWLIEKVVEIGVQRILFWPTARSEKQKINLDRLRKIAISAIKQSKQDWLPTIDTIQSLEQASKSNLNLVAHLNPAFTLQSIPELPLAETNSVNVLIGPEGDFTPTEIEQALNLGYKAITLGPNVLRTETAAMYACTGIRLCSNT